MHPDEQVELALVVWGMIACIIIAIALAIFTKQFGG